MKRITFNQAASWDDSIGEHGAYSHKHCCYCGRALTKKFVWLMLSRDEGGEWYAVDPAEPRQPDEKTFDRFALPIGMTCLKRHP